MVLQHSLVDYEPLSILASAFDAYFVSLPGCPKQGAEDSDDLFLCDDLDCSCSGPRRMRDRLETSIGLQGLAILAKHVPSVVDLFPDAALPNVDSVHANEETMRTLFRKLLQAISAEAPIILFIDE